ncbi:MAG: hypothetical protein V2J89_04385, partial [Halieaceae bacterium]|nr:hypothetical protein [Halieaceae bacterium]
MSTRTLSSFVTVHVARLGLLFLLLLPIGPVGAAATLSPANASIDIGQSLTVAVDGTPPEGGINWSVTSQLTLLSAEGTRATVQGKQAGSGKVTAYVRGIQLSAVVIVSNRHYAEGPLNSAEDRKASGMLKVLKLPGKTDQLAVMLAAVNRGDMDAKTFFNRMAAMNATKDDLIAVKKKLEGHEIQSGNKDLTRLVLGEIFSEGGTAVEEKLLVWRREVTQKAIEAAIQAYRGRIPENNFKMMVAYVGNWVTQQSRALTFAGDIDFSFVSNDTQLAKDLKAKFDQNIRQMTGLSPIALDSVATVHGVAGLEVYIGRHGQYFAELNMNSGEVVDMATGSRTDINGVGMRVTFALERAAADAQGIEVR